MLILTLDRSFKAESAIAESQFCRARLTIFARPVAAQHTRQSLLPVEGENAAQHCVRIRPVQIERTDIDYTHIVPPVLQRSRGLFSAQFQAGQEVTMIELRATVDLR